MNVDNSSSVAQVHARALVAAPPNATEPQMPCWQSAGGQRSFDQIDLDAFVQFVQGREPWQVRRVPDCRRAGCRHCPATRKLAR